MIYPTIHTMYKHCARVVFVHYVQCVTVVITCFVSVRVWYVLITKTVLSILQVHALKNEWEKADINLWIYLVIFQNQIVLSVYQ